MPGFFDKQNLKDIGAFISSIDTLKNGPRATAAAAALVSETVASVKAAEPVTKSHELDIITSSVTDDILLATFEQMPKEQKIILLNSALQTNEKQIAALEQKHRFQKELSWIALRDWVVRVLVIGLIVIGAISLILFGFAMYRNGVSVETKNVEGVASTFFTTLGEILKVILSSDIK